MGIAWRFTRVLGFTAAIHLRSKGLACSFALLAARLVDAENFVPFPSKTSSHFRVEGEVMQPFTVRLTQWAFLLCLSLLLCGLATPVPAQDQKGSISGLLTDPAGAVLRGAQVSIPAQAVNTSTDQQGQFFFSGLPAGSYTLSVSYIGFEKVTKTVGVTAGQTTTVNLQLQVE